MLICIYIIVISLSSKHTSQGAILNCTACSQDYIQYIVSSDKVFCSSQHQDSHCQTKDIALEDNCRTISLTLNLTDKQWWNYTQQVMVQFTATISTLSNGTPLNPPKNVHCTATVNITYDTTGELYVYAHDCHQSLFCVSTKGKQLNLLHEMWLFHWRDTA